MKVSSFSSIVPKRSYYARFQAPSKLQRGEGGRLTINSVRYFQHQQSSPTVAPMYPMFLTASSSSSQVRHFTESINKEVVLSISTNKGEDPFWKKNLLTMACIVSASGAGAAMLNSWNRKTKNENDPYENLPEEDDKDVTTCIFCKIFYESPCRTEFRKMKKCLDDNKNENSENIDAICGRYSLALHECAQQHRNIIRLISNDQLQDFVNEMQNDVPTNERRCWVGNTTTMKSPIKIEWGELAEFVQENGTDFDRFNPLLVKKDTSTSSTTEPLPLWKRYPKDTEPVLFDATAYIPRETVAENDSPNLVLDCAWVVDQDDMNLGFFDSYGKEMEKSSSEEDATLPFTCIPGVTKEVQVYAKYVGNSLSSSNKPDKKVLLFYSKPYSLKDAAEAVAK